MSSPQSEIERKYDVSGTTQTPDLTGVGPVATVGDIEVRELDAVYFDTAALSLAGQRIALRRREGGTDAGWHVKRPADEGRTEQHWPLGGSSNAVPEDIAASLGAADLVPIARVRNRRENRELFDVHGAAVAELSDDHVTAQNLLDGTMRSWREWEVELLGAAPDTRAARTALLDRIEEALFDAGARPSSSSSKLARALGAEPHPDDLVIDETPDAGR